MRKFLLTVCAALLLKPAAAAPFDLVTPQHKVTIVYAADDKKLNSIAANLLAQDIQRVSGYLPVVTSDLNKVHGNAILIGTAHSKLISGLHNMYFSTLSGKWECYSLKVISNLNKNISSALIIAGSDDRGAAYGVFDISARIGVTPWYWWADATPVKKSSISLSIPDYTSQPPSVKYRGLFINDEDWGLQPWAAKTLEPETGDIGPKTYAKVFELLLRLKANLIWPAMHPSTKAFYHYPGNIEVAEDYQIVVGSSHAEPMLRNNVGEWNEKAMGAFNYITNQQKVDDYWESRVKESRNLNAIYSMGMRGVHDSGIEGVKTVQETVPLLERIFGDQRAMLKKYINPDIAKVPQAFTAYKEVLDVYDAGLKVPDDVTLVWPDDNYGYIQRLDDENESKRAGGAGVYYHLSYWGRPHDYIWLSTTSPGLIREEMTKAYSMQARNLWIFNVGDIKPAEYNLQLAMDMAYRIQPFMDSAYPKQHLLKFVADNIGAKSAATITGTLWKYYQLAFERRPEFMGWSQTEPTTKVKLTDYNDLFYGDQGQQRIDAYDALEIQTANLQKGIAPAKRDCFYQLVYYPVIGAAEMNKKFLYRDKAYLYAQQGRLSANAYADSSRAAYNKILKETEVYNNQLASGKWKNIMPAKPRDLPVFQAPDLNYTVIKNPQAWAVAVEGSLDKPVSAALLPLFEKANDQPHFIDIYLTRDTSLNFTVKSLVPWIHVSATAGRLDKRNNQIRLWVNVDWLKAPARGNNGGEITISSGGKQLLVVAAIDVRTSPADFKGFIAHEGYVSIYAKDYQDLKNTGSVGWVSIQGLGATETSLEALPLATTASFKAVTSDEEIKKRPVVSYDFFTPKGSSAAEVKIYTLPTFPLNKNFEVRYAVSLDDGPATVLNFKTIGRSEEWKQNVLSNMAVRSVKLPQLAAVKHTLKVYMIDPGVILDHILIDLGGLKPEYGLLPETRLR